LGKNETEINFMQSDWFVHYLSKMVFGPSWHRWIGSRLTGSKALEHRIVLAIDEIGAKFLVVDIFTKI